MSRNYGIGHRDMSVAGKIFLERSYHQKGISGDSLGTIAERWSQFVRYIKYNKENGIGRMEKITRDSVLEYARHLADKVDAEEMKASYAQNLVSAINSVLKNTPKDRPMKRPGQLCGNPAIKPAKRLPDSPAKSGCARKRPLCSMPETPWQKPSAAGKLR
ncbi:hypothetical protein [Acidithiobacillus sp. HP-11]|uniref:hypothetical protein n=1 Tax=Acidithiobacillus sp. HP-11 TaxID=2697656 RepID=UPI001D0D1BE0|nr:hypothetical protein [Acidithiobacillus sp. HP-11]